MSWTLPAHVTWTPTEYGGVLLDCASGEYWTLNPTARRTLAALLDGADDAQVTERLAADFDGDPDVMAADLPQFLAELCDAGLVVAR
jgi:PqqD family protein of HPr-rel-A system